MPDKQTAEERVRRKFIRDVRKFLRDITKEVGAGDYSSIAVEPIIETFDFAEDMSHVAGLRITLIRSKKNLIRNTRRKT